MRGKAHGHQQAARVIADLLLGSETQKQIAADTGVSERSVARFSAQVPAILAELGEIKKADINELVELHLRQSIVTLTIQLEQFADRDWLAQQSAGELAILFGVINDKAVRILAAAQRAREAPGGE